MSRMGCRCGFVMIFNTGREEYDLALIPESTIEDIGILIDETDSLDAEKYYDMVADSRISVMRCPNCHRFWIEQPDHSYRSYIPEPE